MGPPVRLPAAGRTVLRSAALAALAALGLLALVGCGGGGGGDGGAGGRVLVLGLDGMDPDTVDLLMAEGRMPHFERLRRQGAYGQLESQEPLLSPILWTTIATGRPPYDHGIGHFTALDPASGRDLPVTSDMRRVKALWNLASEAGREVAVVGWWATWPPEPVLGVVVSDHVAYHFLFEEGLNGAGGGAGEAVTWPPELAAEIAPRLRRPADLGAEELARFVAPAAGTTAGPAPGSPGHPFSFDDEEAHLRWAVATAESYRDVGLDLWHRRRPDLELVYVEGTDSVAHLFGHLFRARGLAGELAEQQRRYGGTVEAMYRFADELVGRFLDAIDDDTTLVVLSDHGFRLGELHDDPSRTRDLRRVSERFHRLHGILYLYGRGVKPGARLDDAGLLDVAPTLLTLLGLPAADDMPGRVLVEGLAGAAAEPLPRIASYENAAPPTAGGGAPAPAAGATRRDPTADEALLARLRSLGYLGGGGAGEAADEAASAPAPPAPDVTAPHQSPQGERNLAAIEFEAGRYLESAEAYRRLLEQAPDDPGLRTSYAGALGALGRFDEAEAELRRALAVDPINVEAHHNLGVLAERRGDREAAVAHYREALRYRPDYAPSRQALMLLTGSAATRPTSTPAEARAAELADRASLAARKGDYPAALELLDRAERQAPDFVLVYQYRANVAYLMGDREAAAAALEKAIALEPDNALFRENLRRLRQPAGGR